MTGRSVCYRQAVTGRQAEGTTCGGTSLGSGAKPEEGDMHARSSSRPLRLLVHGTSAVATLDCHVCLGQQDVCACVGCVSMSSDTAPTAAPHVATNVMAETG